MKDNAKSLDNLNQQAKSLAEQQNKKTGQLELSMTEMHSTINDIANNADNAANETDEGRNNPTVDAGVSYFLPKSRLCLSSLKFNNQQPFLTL